MKRGAFKKVRREEVPDGATFLKSRFVDAIKHVETSHPKFKSRHVMQGHKDKEKPFIVHEISPLRQSSTKMIFPTSAVITLRVFSHNVYQEFLRGKE